VTGIAAADGSVRLRLPVADDVPTLDAWEASPEAQGEFNDFDREPHSYASAIEKGFVDEHHGTLIVETADGGEALGTVNWRPSMYGPRSRAWQLGISLLPEGRGHGYGARVLRLVTSYLFETTDANRVEAQTDVENVAAQRALERAGFRREGTARGAQWRRGAFHDLYIYACLRDERA
jgi:RimJ/RimL family protein N-acetyltransferase